MTILHFTKRWSRLTILHQIRKATKERTEQTYTSYEDKTRTATPNDDVIGFRSQLDKSALKRFMYATASRDAIHHGCGEFIVSALLLL